MVSFRGTYWLSRAYFILFRVFFLSISFFFSFFFVDFTTWLGIKGWVASALVINYCNWIGSVWRKIELHLTSTCLLEIPGTEYLCETNISIFICHSLMVPCSLDALKKSSKRKGMRIKNGKVEVLQQTIYSRKETGK